jgi:hypothetical protein
MQGLQGKMVEVPAFEPRLHREAKSLADVDLLDDEFLGTGEQEQPTATK